LTYAFQCLPCLPCNPIVTKKSDQFWSRFPGGPAYRSERACRFHGNAIIFRVQKSYQGFSSFLGVGPDFLKNFNGYFELVDVFALK